MKPESEPLERRLSDVVERLGSPLDAAQQRKLLDYVALLVRWNSTYNLTAVRDPELMLTQHLADCLATVAPIRRVLAAPELRIVDVGSGGGLPGVVLAIAQPAWHVTCVDAVGKKAAFVRQVAVELRLPRLQAAHARIEQWHADAADLVVSRAFSRLAPLVEQTRHLLSAAGVWMAMKGLTPDAEIRELPADVTVFHVEQLQVPMLDAERCLVWMRPQ